MRAGRRLVGARSQYGDPSRFEVLPKVPRPRQHEDIIRAGQSPDYDERHAEPRLDNEKLGQQQDGEPEQERDTVAGSYPIPEGLDHAFVGRMRFALICIPQVEQFLPGAARSRTADLIRRGTNGADFPMRNGHSELCVQHRTVQVCAQGRHTVESLRHAIGRNPRVRPSAGGGGPRSNPLARSKRSEIDRRALPRVHPRVQAPVGTGSGPADAPHEAT
jgi:hypothetical protein